MAEVSLRNVTKRFDTVEAVRGINLDIPDNEFVVLVGPSGCGKSTTLRMIAGLEEVTSGDDSDRRRGRQRPAAEGSRHRHGLSELRALSAHDGLREHVVRAEAARSGEGRDQERVDEAARILDITELLERKPRALSGGQRQRVAMGRAIVRNPKVFLFDEPLSNLDAKLRVQMRIEIKRVHQLVKTTTVYVTHDQVEAMTLADRVVVMNDGSIEQIAHAAGALSPSENALRRRLHRLAGDEFHALPRWKENGSELRVRLSDAISLPVPASRVARYRSLAGKELIFGLRPEHITEPRRGDREAELRVRARRSTSSSRWAWRRWCISPSTASKSAAASIPAAPRSRAKPCGSLPIWITCT